jgi:probable rRNA maturation factor
MFGSVSDSSFDIKNTTRGRLPSLPFLAIKEKVLGKNYDLSVAFVGKDRIRNLNRIYRNKDRVTDVLSFPLTKNSGELFIHLPRAESNAKKFGRKPKNHVIFLFIHGLLHLKGMDHGSRMEREEKTFGSFFGI